MREAGGPFRGNNDVVLEVDESETKAVPFMVGDNLCCQKSKCDLSINYSVWVRASEIG